MEVGSGEQLGSLGGAGGIKNSRAFFDEMLFDF